MVPAALAEREHVVYGTVPARTANPFASHDDFFRCPVDLNHGDDFVRPIGSFFEHELNGTVFGIRGMRRTVTSTVPRTPEKIPAAISILRRDRQAM